MQVYRTLKLIVKDSLTLPHDTVIQITPNTIEDKIYELGKPLIFGKEDTDNHYNFPNDEKIGRKQFDIIYDEGKVFF